ncbi:hypothetical protein J5TS2_41050 [Brevibacillus halotolerans]|uniref:hypothetical protein n=1 Tax=Brevibacillus halotolerans TaxID=1507437 RepID=UPI001B27F38F|nr:hypothetical protein [Brevibacillus halotolerans]GIO03437.1 hypothetical protein J5TS2_41050 [Brevibacillus halotolerans]
MTNYNIVCSYTNKEGLETSETIAEEFWACGIEEVMYLLKRKADTSKSIDIKIKQQNRS